MKTRKKKIAPLQLELDLTPVSVEYIKDIVFTPILRIERRHTYSFGVYRRYCRKCHNYPNTTGQPLYEYANEPETLVNRYM